MYAGNSVKTLLTTTVGAVMMGGCPRAGVNPLPPPASLGETPRAGRQSLIEKEHKFLAASVQ